MTENGSGLTVGWSGTPHFRLVDNSISMAWGRQGHKGSVRGPRSSFGGTKWFLSVLYIPLANIKHFFSSSFLSSFKVPNFC